MTSSEQSARDRNGRRRSIVNTQRKLLDEAVRGFLNVHARCSTEEQKAALADAFAGRAKEILGAG